MNTRPSTFCIFLEIGSVTLAKWSTCIKNTSCKISDNFVDVQRVSSSNIGFHQFLWENITYFSHFWWLRLRKLVFHASLLSHEHQLVPGRLQTKFGMVKSLFWWVIRDYLLFSGPKTLQNHPQKHKNSNNFSKTGINIHVLLVCYGHIPNQHI